MQNQTTTVARKNSNIQHSREVPGTCFFFSLFFKGFSVNLLSRPTSCASPPPPPFHRLGPRNSTATSVTNGITILAPDATGGSGNSSSLGSRYVDISDDVEKGSGGERQRLEEKGGRGVPGVGEAVGGPEGCAEGGAGGRVIDVDLSG